VVKASICNDPPPHPRPTQQGGTGSGQLHFAEQGTLRALTRLAHTCALWRHT
jgi:hypothetical protein